jgi:decaprenyl-phosphate phosphoribosyltransferase
MYGILRNGSFLTMSMRIEASPSSREAISAVFGMLRPRQWTKNAFVMAPLFFTPPALSLRNVELVAAGIVSFCALASAIYILNDYFDREADRKHPEKRFRPLAAGTISVGVAFTLFAILLTGGFAIALLTSYDFTWIAIGYVALNLAYSFGLKNVAILDVLIIALGFTLRVQAGAVLIDIAPSAWIVITTGLLALFLALAKRRDDISRNLGNDHRKSLSGYTLPFLDVAATVMLGALLVAYMIYTTDADVMKELNTDKIYYTTPFVVAGILRYLQIALVENGSGSPTDVVLSDRFLITTIVGWAITFGILIHG